MQVIDCRNFRELLDSYLSEELTVETNHSMLRHTEVCPGCRTEMSSRRRMRAALKRACSREQMSEEACDRLRVLLRAETSSMPDTGWIQKLGNYFTLRQALPSALAVTALIIITAAVAVWMTGLRERGPVGEGLKPEAALSAALIDEAIGDHRNCGLKFLKLSGPFEMPPSVAQYDPSYANLERIAAPGARDLELRTAHLCGFKGRKFAHLVYARNEHAISLLVTERDKRALQLSQVPLDDGEPAGGQLHRRESLALGACQTSRYVVMVVSDLTDDQNRQLLERLAIPVAGHLRKSERRLAIHADMSSFSGARQRLIY